MLFQLLWNAVVVAMTLVMQSAFEALWLWLLNRFPQLRRGAHQPTTEGIVPSSDGCSDPVSERPEQRLR